MTQLKLPQDGGTHLYTLAGSPLPSPTKTAFNRIAFSAAHVVADPLSAKDPSGPPAIDWKATVAYRRYLLGLGLGVAEAMDTAQRGMGLDWPGALELIRRTLEETRDIPGALIFSGCGTDHLDPGEARSVDDVLRAYDEQVSAIQKLNGRVVLMASRALVRVAKTAEAYLSVYRKVLSSVDQPVILHWLGEMFDPALDGYWGTRDFERAMKTCLAVIEENAAKVDGIKISLLDKDKEIRMRRLLPKSVRMYTGDDFNYPELIAGDARGYSHALLGIFDAIAPAASLALDALASGDHARFFSILQPTVPLSRLIFRTPTQYYKTGVVFLAYLNGHQEHFIMVGGAQSMRALPYFVDVFKLADQANLLRDPELAAARMKALLEMYGWDG